MRFFIEQIALYPPDPDAARKLLSALGLDEWVEDTVGAGGRVRGAPAANIARLAFNYQATRGVAAYDPISRQVAGAVAKPIELEVLNYVAGPSWIMDAGPCVSHLGMHVTSAELDKFRGIFGLLGYEIAQEVRTASHTNPAISGKRLYDYVIFDTRAVLGVDLKFIVRHEIATP